MASLEIQGVGAYVVLLDGAPQTALEPLVRDGALWGYRAEIAPGTHRVEILRQGEPSIVSVVSVGHDAAVVQVASSVGTTQAQQASGMALSTALILAALVGLGVYLAARSPSVSVVPSTPKIE